VQGFIRQRQEGIAFGAAEAAAELLAGEEEDKRAGQEQAEEYG
jgi:hypothetical protein